MNRDHDQGKSYKTQHLIGAGLQVQRFSPLSSRQEHGSIQVGVVQEEWRVKHLPLKAASRRLTSRQLGWGSYTYTHSEHLLQPGHTYSNKATPPNGATPWSKNIQTITVTDWVFSFKANFPILNIHALLIVLEMFQLWSSLSTVYILNLWTKTYRQVEKVSSLYNPELIFQYESWLYMREYDPLVPQNCPLETQEPVAFLPL